MILRSLSIAKSRLEELTVKAATIDTEARRTIRADILYCPGHGIRDWTFEEEKLCEYEVKEYCKANLELKYNQISEMAVFSNGLKDRMKYKTHAESYDQSRRDTFKRN